MSLPHAIVTIANPEMQAAWMRQIQAYSFRLCHQQLCHCCGDIHSQRPGGSVDGGKLRTYLRNNLEEILTYIQVHNLPLIPYRPEGSFLFGWTAVKHGVHPLTRRPVNLQQVRVQLFAQNQAAVKAGPVFLQVALPHTAILADGGPPAARKVSGRGCSNPRSGCKSIRSCSSSFAL